MTAKPAKRQPYRASEDRRRQIAEAALVCLERDGYARLTARAVAAEAGLSLGHITYHFQNMDELLSEAYRLASARLRDVTARHLAEGSANPLQRLAAFLDAGFSPDLLSRGYLRLRIDLWSAAVAHPSLAATETALYDSYREELRAHLRTVAGDPAKRAERIDAVADAIMALLDGLWLDWMRRSDRAAIDNGLAACLDLARGLEKP